MTIDKNTLLEYQKTFRENNALREVLATHAKEARNILRLTNQWQQAFDGNEIVGVMAIYMATWKALVQKQEALGIAIEWIGDAPYIDDGTSGNEVLELINQTIAGESIDETIARIDSRETH